MPCKQTKGLPPRPEVGLIASIFPYSDSHCGSEVEVDSGKPIVQKCQCKVMDVDSSVVKVQWLGSKSDTVDVPLTWWHGGAFAPIPVPQLEPTCELCGVVFNAEFCSGLLAGVAMARDCPCCSGLALLASGSYREAETQMRSALREMKAKLHDLGQGDALCRHWSSVRTAYGLLESFPSPVPLSIAEVERAQEVDVSSLDAFAGSWRRWLERYLASEEYREKAQLRVTLGVSRAKRLHGDGFREEIARRRAEESPAWRAHHNLAESRRKCTQGMEHVKRIANQGKMTVEKMNAILAQKQEELQLRTAALVEHESSAGFREAQAAIENYSRWYHNSGIATFQEERQRLGLHLPSVSGKFLEDVASVWLEQDVSNLPPLNCGLERKVLRNVCFRGVSLPDAVASEFDAMVVVCRRCEDSFHAPKQAGCVEGLWQVVELERWVEVKSNPDEVFEAWCRHRDARVALAAWRGYIAHDAGSAGRVWFPAEIFAKFSGGVTFVTSPGCGAVVHRGSHVPRSLLTPPALVLRLFQFALDRLKPPLAMDVNDPAAHWDYVEELYNRSGEIFMHEGEDANDYLGYFQTALEQLRELVDKGQVLVVKDPFAECYAAQRQHDRMPPSKLATDELVQSISVYAARG